MDNSCVICKKDATYKCPTCLISYCSAICCKEHKKDNCVIKKPEITEKESENAFTTPSTVPKEKLELLRESKELKEMLGNNPHLRNLLSSIDKCENVEDMMQKVMLEPIFVEFADECLKIVEDKNNFDN
ncbi:unnamed protein product [Brassicogethes aeneus]|uniref:HIT-type domain-containing protein n=1 Tax=Brassicogethes aeneus TaxID=1431903 RepID=A0A9P0BIM4_BRAAE|nr:unnamed protein product [Brassicogethes aeneus]